MRLKILVAAVALFFCAVPVDRFQQTTYNWKPEKIQEYTKTVSIIFSDYEDGRSSGGAGVVIAPDGTTLTVAHLFEPNCTIEMRVTNGNVYDMDLLAVDTSRDLALIRPKRAAHSFTHAKLGKQYDKIINDDIVAIGHPLLFYWHAEYGVILSVIWHPGYRGDIMLLSALVRPGNSGGPVLNTKGEVIGIVSAYSFNIFTGEYIAGIAVAPSEIHKFLARAETQRPYWPKQVKRYRLGDVK